MNAGVSHQYFMSTKARYELHVSKAASKTAAPTAKDDFVFRFEAGPPDASGVQHVRVVTHTFYFEPNRIVLKAGQPVELTVKNAAWFVPHNLTCNAKEAGIEVMADVGFFGGSRHTRFTPTKAGEYEFFCHEDAHAKKGMRGTFVVVP